MLDLARIEDLLRQKYGQPTHGNKADPLDELFFVILSSMTSTRNCIRAFNQLKERFADWEQLLQASEDEVVELIKHAGLGYQRSSKLIAIARRIKRDFGVISLSSLNKLSTHDAEDYLISLPGVGKKTARCVLMYSFGRAVFPVDTHCARIMRRLGFEVPNGSWQKCEDKLQDQIPEGLRYSLHVTFISLGRDLCVWKNPKCEVCPLNTECRTGLEKLGL
jgi:endonuclease III